MEVVFLNRPIGQSAEDNLLLQLQGMFAEYERTKMLERSRRGKRHLARAGVPSVMARAPFGYRYVGREAGGGVPRFDVAEDQAEVVRAIFRWVGRERITLSAVCRRLLEAGVPSPTGLARWGRSTVWNLLSNPAYIGRASFGKCRVVPWQPPLRPAHGRGSVPKHPCRRVSVPPDQQIPIPVPPLVEVGLFETVQEQLAESRRTVRQHRGGAKYLLQGLLVCSRCGYAFCGTQKRFHQPQRKQHYYYYRCTRTDAWRLGGERRCDARMMPVERLDAAVWDEVGRILADPARVIREHQRRLEGMRASPRQQELVAVERQLAKLRRGIDRLIDSYAEGVIDKSEFEPRLSALRTRVNATEAAAAAVRDAAEQARSLTLVIGKIEAFAEIIKDRLEAADWTTKRDVIRTLVRRVEVDDEAIRGVFRIGPGPSDGGAARHLRVHHCPGRGRGVGGGAAHDPGRPALVLAPGDPDRPDLRAVFRLALRQTEGLIGSILRLLGLDLAVPDHTTSSLRAGTLEVPRPRPTTGGGPVHLLVDSTGLKVGGPGEWLAEQHGTRTRRAWRKLHLGVDAGTGRIEAVELTTKEADDASRVGPLLDQVDGPVASLTGDGAYDRQDVEGAVADRHPEAAVVVPPRRDAVPSGAAETAPTQRDCHLRSIAERGRMGWQKSSGYDRRASAEAAMSRYKRVIGDALRS